ncbi:hypothetical protein BC628DRAFT_215089 [Trametes gibbosa]|nr:hypothetical protein BC628DRAFT_215089 [Trametes gibbosa]
MASRFSSIPPCPYSSTAQGCLTTTKRRRRSTGSCNTTSSLGRRWGRRTTRATPLNTSRRNLAIRRRLSDFSRASHAHCGTLLPRWTTYTSVWSHRRSSRSPVCVTKRSPPCTSNSYVGLSSSLFLHMDFSSSSSCIVPASFTCPAVIHPPFPSPFTSYHTIPDPPL